MRFVKRLSMFFAVAVMTASVAHAQEYNRFGKGPTTAGLTPTGYGVNSYSRGNVYYVPAPIVATSPRMFILRPHQRLRLPQQPTKGGHSRLSRRRRALWLPRRRLRR